MVASSAVCSSASWDCTSALVLGVGAHLACASRHTAEPDHLLGRDVALARGAAAGVLHAEAGLLCQALGIWQGKEREVAPQARASHMPGVVQDGSSYSLTVSPIR